MCSSGHPIVECQAPERVTPLCATSLLHRGFRLGYPCAIQSFYPIMREDASNSAQSCITLMTGMREASAHSLHSLLLISDQSPGTLRFIVVIAADVGTLPGRWRGIPGVCRRHGIQGCTLPTMVYRGVHYPPWSSGCGIPAHGPQSVAYPPMVHRCTPAHGP